MKQKTEQFKPKTPGRFLRTGFRYEFIHYSDDPDRDSAWAKAKSIEYGGMQSARWQREMEGNWRTYLGDRVWPMVDRQCHHRVYDVRDKSWALYRVIDHGVRHPTCCLWVAVNRNGDRHVYREYYMTDTPISVNCQNIIRMTGDEDICATYIDPSTRRRENYMSSSKGDSLSRICDIYEDNGIICEKADNSSVGYDRVQDALMSQLARAAVFQNQLSMYLSEMGLNESQILQMSSKPALTFDLNSCNRSFGEVENLRWKNLTGSETEKSKPESIMDVDDEGADCLRYSFSDGIFWRRPRYKPPVGSWQSDIMKRKVKQIVKRHAWA